MKPNQQEQEKQRLTEACEKAIIAINDIAKDPMDALVILMNIATSCGMAQGINKATYIAAMKRHADGVWK